MIWLRNVHLINAGPRNLGIEEGRIISIVPVQEKSEGTRDAHRADVERTAKDPLRPSPLPTTKEWGEGQGEGPPEGWGCKSNEPLSPTQSPLVPRLDRPPRTLSTHSASEPQRMNGPPSPTLSPSEGERGRRHQRFDKGKFKGREPARGAAGAAAGSASVELRFENCIAFPGLINSHDHLEFNLF